VEVTLLYFSVSKDIINKNNNYKRRIPTYMLAYLLTLIVKKLKISVEQGRAVTFSVLTKFYDQLMRMKYFTKTNHSCFYDVQTTYGAFVSEKN